jgi:hypothetical protein
MWNVMRSEVPGAIGKTTRMIACKVFIMVTRAMASFNHGRKYGIAPIM